MRVRRLIFGLLISVAMPLSLVASCEEEHPCIEPDLACDPLYDPEFTEIFNRTLVPRCGVDGPCHSPEGMRGGMVFRDEQTSYDLLLGNIDGRARVIPGDPSCSELSKRITSGSKSFQMPPGMPMNAAEICSIQKWIEMGAPR